MKKVYYKNLRDAQYMSFHFGIETYSKKLGVDEELVKKKYWKFFEPREKDILKVMTWFKDNPDPWEFYYATDLEIYTLRDGRVRREIRAIQKIGGDSGYLESSGGFHTKFSIVERDNKPFLMPEIEE